MGWIKMGKKRKNVDFQKVKIKVGRKLPRLNETNIDLRTRKLNIVDQGLEVGNVYQVTEKKNFYQIAKKLSFSNQSEDHLSGLQQVHSWIESDDFSVSSITPTDILRTLVPHCRNTKDPKISSAACSLMGLLMHRLSSTKFSEFHAALAAAPLTTLDHVDAGVRQQGPSLLKILAEQVPNAVCHSDHLQTFTASLQRYRERLASAISESTYETLTNLIETHSAVLNCIKVDSKSSMKSATVAKSLRGFDLDQMYWKSLVDFYESDSSLKVLESVKEDGHLDTFCESTLKWCGELWHSEIAKNNGELRGVHTVRRCRALVNLVCHIYRLHVGSITDTHDYSVCAQCTVRQEVLARFPLSVVSGDRSAELEVNCKILELVGYEPKVICAHSDFAARLHGFLTAYFNKKMNSTDCKFWLKFSRPVITCWDLRSSKTSRLLLSLVWRLAEQNISSEYADLRLSALTMLTEALEVRWAAGKRLGQEQLATFTSVEPFSQLPMACVASCKLGHLEAIRLLLRMHALRYSAATDQLLRHAVFLEESLDWNDELLFRTLCAAVRTAQQM